MKLKSNISWSSKKSSERTCKNKNFSYNDNTHETAFHSEVCPATGDDLTCGFFIKVKKNDKNNQFFPIEKVNFFAIFYLVFY